ncbi:MAG: acyl carrier protein [Lachnospiraceae bacterium]
MTNQEKLEKLEEIMDLEAGQLSEDSILADFEEWDSIAILSVIALLDEEFGKTVKGADIKKCVTVKDAMNLME